MTARDSLQTLGAPLPLDPIEALARVGGDAALLAELVVIFEQESFALLGEIRGAAANRHAKSLEQAAHRLRGSAGSFGPTSIGSPLLTLEQMGRDQQWDGVTGALAELERELPRLLDGLHAMVATT